MSKSATTHRHTLAIVLAMAGLAAALGVSAYLFIAGTGDDFMTNPKATNKLAACGSGSLLTTSPVAINQIPAMTPMGNINAPGGHVFLSDHTGIAIYKKDGSSRPGPGDTLATNLYAPGSIHIIGIRKTDYQGGNTPATSDYGIAFANCKGHTFYFNHVHSVSLNLETGFTKAKKVCHKVGGGGTSMTACDAHVDVAVQAGQQLGVIGGVPNTAGIDFGSFATIGPALAFIHPKRLPRRTLYARCPLDYFNSEISAQLYTKLSRQVEPRCGEVMQDKLGTLQGNWYAKGKKEFDWSAQLGLLHDTSDPQYAVLSIGGLVASAREIGFTPTSAGAVNREPAQVTPGATVYCYQADPNYEGQGDKSGSVILQLTDTRTLTVERKNADCATSPAFQSPTVYVR